MEDGTELTVEQVIELLGASRSMAQEMVDVTKDQEHQAIFASIAGLTNVLIEVIKRLMEIGEMAEQEDLD